MTSWHEHSFAAVSRSSVNKQLWAAFVSLLLPCLALQAQQDAAGVYRQARDVVVLIQGRHQIGSGVIIPGGCPAVVLRCAVVLIVTNYHVVSGENSVTVKFVNGLELPATEVVASDPDADLAILKLEGATFAPSELGDSGSLAIGQRIFVISNPLGLEGSVTEGLISALREVQGRKLLQISAPISPGSSGGPVFDQQARVVGIATATIEGAQNVNLAVPSAMIQSLLGRPKAGKLSELPARNVGSASVSGILRRVSRYLLNDMVGEAEAQLRAGIQEYEFESALRLELAKLLIRSGRSDEALQQLRVCSKLAADQWQPVALIGHLYLQRWLKDGRLSDRQAAYQAYNGVLARPGLPPAKRDSYRTLQASMRDPVGLWATSDGRRRYQVLARTGGGFSIGTPLDEFKLYQPGTSLDGYADRYLAFTVVAGEFHVIDEQGKYVGTSSFMDASCGYQQALQIEIGPDGTTMDVKGTINQVTGVRTGMIQALGRKRAEQMCKKPGGSGLGLWLTRLPTMEHFYDALGVLNAETQPITVPEQ